MKAVNRVASRIPVHPRVARGPKAKAAPRADELVREAYASVLEQYGVSTPATYKLYRRLKSFMETRRGGSDILVRWSEIDKALSKMGPEDRAKAEEIIKSVRSGNPSASPYDVVEALLSSGKLSDSAKQRLVKTTMGVNMRLLKMIDEAVREETGMGLLRFLDKRLKETRDPEHVVAELASIIASKAERDPRFTREINKAVRRSELISSGLSSASEVLSSVAMMMMMALMGILSRMPGGENAGSVAHSIAYAVHGMQRGLTKGARLPRAPIPKHRGHRFYNASQNKPVSTGAIVPHQQVAGMPVQGKPHSIEAAGKGVGSAAS